MQQVIGIDGEKPGKIRPGLLALSNILTSNASSKLAFFGCVGRSKYMTSMTRR